MFSGAQISLYPMCDRFVEVILKAVEEIAGREGLRVETDDISTLIVGTPRAVFEATRDLYLSACGSGEHVVLNALFSRGCPGEPDDPICTPSEKEAEEPELMDMKGLALWGIPLVGQYSVYPLGTTSYMDTVLRQIEAAKGEGVYGGAKHFATRLEGDGARIFAALYYAFERTARDTGHVAIHAILSAHSPSRKGEVK